MDGWTAFALFILAVMAFAAIGLVGTLYHLVALV